MRIEPLFQISTAWSGISNRLVVHLFEGYVSIVDMENMEAFGDGFHKNNPGDTVDLVVIYPSESRMSQEERARMTKLIKRWEGRRRASATVILAEGMLGAMHRSVLTGLMLIVRPPHPVKVFAAIHDAVIWLEPHIRRVSGQDIARVDLLNAVDDLCRAFESRSIR